MERVLYIPDDWETQWGPIIEQIKADKLFQLHHGCYSNRCDISNSDEEPFYELLVGMLNIILHVTCNALPESVMLGTPQHHITNDSGEVFCEALKETPPSRNVGTVHHHLPRHPKNELGSRHLSQSDRTRAQPIQVLEVKPFHGALVDGSNMPRLKRSGKHTKNLNVLWLMEDFRTRPTG